MENSWQVKCGSTLQSSTPSMASSSSQELPNQTERNGHTFFNPHDPCDSRQRMVQHSPFTNHSTLSSHKSGQVNLGNSFLALLSGPPSLLHNDFRELPNSKPMSESNIVLVNTVGSGISSTTRELPLEYPIDQNMQLGTEFCSSISTRVVEGSNCSSNSVSHGLQGQGPETIHCMVPASEKSKGSSAVSGEWHSTVASNAGRVSSTKVQTSQMKSLEANSSFSNQSFSFLSDCPRVICLRTGGYLLISNTGLLGIVCSCHYIHTSVLKFCEHSGICGINPGYAVRMDNGKTIAQWRKLYFQKFGIRVPEDQSDWDWPDGLSTTSGLMKSRTTLPSVSSNCLVQSSEGLLSSGQLFNNVMLSKNYHTDQNLVIDASQNKWKSDVFDSDHVPLNGLIETSQRNMEWSRSQCSRISRSVGGDPQDGHQSSSAFIDSILKNKNPSITDPGLQDVRTNAQTSDFSMFKNVSNSVFASKDGAFSNVELKLGQPYQHSKCSYRPALGPQLLDAVVNPFKEQNQLNLGNNAFEISNVDDAATVEKSKSNLSQNAVVSLLANFNLLDENNVRIKPHDNITSGIEHTVPNTEYYEPCFAKFDQANIPCYSGNVLERQLNISGIGSHGLIDKGKGGKLVADGSYFVKDSGSRIDKEIEISTYHPHFSAPQGSSCDSYQLSSVPLEAPDARKLSNHAENFPTFVSSLHVDHVNYRSLASHIGCGLITPSQAVTKEPTALCSLDQTSALHREESIGVSPHLLDDNLRMLALRQILELSKQQHTFYPFGMRKLEGRYDGVSHLCHSLAESSALGEQRIGPGPTSSREVSEAAARTCLPGATSMNGCCDLSSLIRGIPSNSKEISVQCHLSNDPLRNEQHSIGSEKNIAGPSEQKNCCRVPSTCFQCNCNFSVHRNCFEKNLESTIGSLPGPLKEKIGIIKDEASVILPKFAKNPIIPNDEIILLDQEGKFTGKLPRNIVTHASQWKDVPSKAKGVSNVMFRGTPAKHVNGTKPVLDSFTEHEISNISSGSSAPAITQLSGDVSNTECSSADAGNTGCVSNLLDEGSGIDKCWSSDDAHGSERSADFLGDTHKTSLKESASSKNLNDQPSRSLLDELKLINSLTWKKGQKQIQNGIPLLNEDNLSSKFNRCLKKGKIKRDCSSLIQYESTKPTNSAESPSCVSKSMQMLSLSNSLGKSFDPCLNQHNSEHRLSILSSVRKPSRKRNLYNFYNGKKGKGVCWKEQKAGASNCEIPQSSGKKLRWTPSNDEAGTVKKYISLGRLKSSIILQENMCGWKSKPIVCGNYGELSNRGLVGGMSKPAKIVPLSNVLKSAKRCTLPKSGKLTSMKELKKTDNDGTDGLSNGFHHLETEKESRSHNAAICSEINIDSSLEKLRDGCSSSNTKYDEENSMLETQTHDRSKKDIGKEDSIPHARLKPRTKEIRKRSIHELTVDGKSSHPKTVSCSKIAKCFPEITEGQLLQNGEDGKHGLCNVAEKSLQEQACSSALDSDSLCSVCGGSNKDEINYLLECSRCLIRVHQACYGVSRVPKGNWNCRPCRTSSRNIVCVLCGYGGGAMTQALRSRPIIKSLLRVWNVETQCKPNSKHFSVKSLQNSMSSLDSFGSGCGVTSFPVVRPVNTKLLASAVCEMDMSYDLDAVQNSPCVSKFKEDNSITAGLLDSTTKQWVHMVCGLWTPGTRCPNVDTMSAFDVSGAPRPRADVVCSICDRPGGSCIKCRNLNCSVRFHPWCAHQKGLLQSEVEGVDNENVGFYGRCVLHATHPMCESDSVPADRVTRSSGAEELTCARTEGYKGRKRDGFWHNYYIQSNGKGGCHVPQDQLNAWIHINGQKPCTQGLPKLMKSDIEPDCRKEYARYKQARGWKHLVVYKSGIHALGLYTSRFISRGEMVVEYIGEIVGLRVSDKREHEYQYGRKLQYKSACYFFRIDKEHIIDATRKGGIARFVNHSCLPNCVAKVISVRNDKKVVFFAERDIFPGEEITYDYHFNHEDEGKKIPCFCNSKNCRRYLN
ncbi:Methyltransferase [Parasponia andersonii]|uniref:Methyltransferase n=1 Tax=Parasponia andersonii TaxID=3476 RepID=A0A2P5DDD4_PARAD|nr:Methyltransferase [Parasponia andersonii]